MLPDERQTLIKSYANAYDRLEAALYHFPKQMWTYRAGPDEWTIHETIVHMADSEVNSYVRCRRIIAEPGSEVLGYDEEAWAKKLDYHARSAQDALRLLRALRAANAELVRSLPDEVWANAVNHSENGRTTLDDWLHTYERHIPEHIAQMRAVYETWRMEQDQ